MAQFLWCFLQMLIDNVSCHYRCSILACSSYVALGLGDNVMALVHAQRLLSQSNLVGALK